VGNQELFDAVRKNYPRFVAGPPAQVFCVPIKGGYHQKLFPELAFITPLPLFPDHTLLRSTGGQRTPGNTIRKVYLCRAKITKMRAGDILLFYQSSDLEELLRLTAKRSVFTETELRMMLQERPTPLRVIDFLLIGHVHPSVPLAVLKAEGVFNGAPPQSICQLSHRRFAPIRERLEFGYEL
jgi:hypothetical protein